MTPDQFKLLIERYIAGDCTEDELQTLKNLLDQPGYIGLLEDIMDQQLEESQAHEIVQPETISRIQENISAQIAAETSAIPEKGRLYPFRKWAAAAAIVALFSILAVYFLRSTNTGINTQQLASDPSIIEAGKDGAVLTLVDGSTVVLDSMGNGLVTTQNGTKVLLRNGQLIYDGNDVEIPIVGYNSMSTPKGRQFKLVLPDGTRVWLNAASSIRYPVVFSEDDRKVEITGEAYFEVARDVKKPFIVSTHDGTEVEVLGTQFNINSYDNEESINTTLLEGSVRVTNKHRKIVLTPGQQAQSSNAGLTLKKNVNVAQVMAWKNGQFDFNNASLREVMRQLERWYNIEVEYAPGVKNYEFVGKMDRGLSLQEVLKGLELSEVRFEITSERKIIVKP